MELKRICGTFLRESDGIVVGSCDCLWRRAMMCCGFVYAKIRVVRNYGSGLRMDSSRNIPGAYVNRYNWTTFSGQAASREWRDDIENGTYQVPDPAVKTWISSCRESRHASDLGCVSGVNSIGWYLSALAEVYQPGTGFVKYISHLFPATERDCRLTFVLDAAWPNTKVSLCLDADSAWNCSSWTEFSPGDSYSFPPVAIGPDTNTYHPWYFTYKVERI